MRRGRGVCSSLRAPRDLGELCVQVLGQSGQTELDDLGPGLRRDERLGGRARSCFS